MLDYKDECADCAMEYFDARAESDEFLPHGED
jgi:hypothetical protein